jgi:nucleoside-diphosphate-sugar epimerase
VTTLVTGAEGFLGRHVMQLLGERGESPRAYRGDVADPAALEAGLEGVDRVLHCAARTGPWGPEAEYRRTNVDGLETLVRTAMTAGVRRVVHVSSITVHGNDVRGWADEGAPLRGEPNPYSRSKVAGEQLLQRLIRDAGAPVTIVRPGWIYGPGDHASFGRLAERIAGGRMVVIGRGDNHLPLIHVRDVARGILLASETAGAEGKAYLLVNDEPVTQREYLDAIAAELGVPGPSRQLRYRPALVVGAAAETVWGLACRREPPPVMRYGLQMLGGDNRFDIARAREELGFEPRIEMADGVRQTVAWYRDTAEASDVRAVAA